MLLKHEQIHNNERLEIVNIVFLIYIIYSIAIWLCDMLDLLCYVIHLPQVTVISRILVIVILIGLCCFFKGKIKAKKIKINFFFYIAAIFIIIFGIFKAIIPDTSYDVMSYHILAQTPGFTNRFQINVAPGDFQLFGFLLPDRMFYIFRMILGYRMGTLFNSIIMILIYLQVIDLLQTICGKELQNIRCRCEARYKFGFLISFLFMETFLAFPIVFFHDIVLQTGSYMVEILAIPFALEILRMIFKKKEDIRKKEIIYFALLNGIFFCTKMTNIVYIIPILIIFIIKNRKQLSWQIFLISALFCVLPVSIYLVYNYISTGNPVFPYFNTFFKSIYFNIENFKDNRWGYSNLRELLLWPLYMIFRPQYRQSEIPNSWPYALIGGFFAILFVVIYNFKNKFKEKKDILNLMLFFIISLYLWAFTTGHIRYFIFGNIINGILCVILLANIVQKKHYWNGIITIAIIGVLIMQPVNSFIDDAKGIEWSWRTLDKKSYLDNIKYVFNDYSFDFNKESKNIDLFVLNKNSFGSVANQISADTPVILYPYIDNRISDKQQQAIYKNFITEYLEEGKDIYDIGNYFNIAAQVSSITNNHFYINEIDYVDSYFVGNNAILLYKLEKMQENNTNDIYYANINEKNKFNFTKAILTDIGTEELAHLEMIGTIFDKLIEGATKDELIKAGFDGYFIEHGCNPFYINTSGQTYNTVGIGSKGDAKVDMYEDMAAEQKARITYENLIKMTDDPLLKDTLRYLREREVVHFQRFGETLRLVEEYYGCKKVF